MTERLRRVRTRQVPFGSVARFRVVLFTTIAIVTLAGCLPGSRTRGLADAEPPVVAVEAQPIAPDGIRETITVNGEIEPVSSVDVFPTAAGELIEIRVAVGDRVRRDDVIARVDPSRPGQVFSPSAIGSPIAGTVTRLSARVGAQVTQQAPIARIATTDELQLTTFVPERFVQGVAVGQTATVRLDAYPTADFAARITRLSPVIDPQTRTLETTLTLTTRDARVRPGMFARVELVLNERPDALTVPQPAVVRRDGRPHVFVVSADDRAELRPVTTGIESAGRIELVSGVSVGERVVTRGQNLLDAGTPVRVVELARGEP
ncbi:MAG: efflux RND transporter periplasmic adaptor subunit [Spirochaetaceae bacterium]|nr:MAG: efflux RND transporter periplasmic adaptor subunit [Spirochaetaceae bacterium]